MDMNRISGLLFSGFATKVYALGLALWIAAEVAGGLSGSMGALQHGLALAMH